METGNKQQEKRVESNRMKNKLKRKIKIYWWKFCNLFEEEKEESVLSLHNKWFKLQIEIFALDMKHKHGIEIPKSILKS